MADRTADKIIVALDVPDYAQANEIISDTWHYVGWYKVGLELIATQNCASIIGLIKQTGRKVFYDIKLHDIPTTVERAVKAARRLSVDLINMHATAGVEAMRKAKEAAGDALSVAAVTVLTSMDAHDLGEVGFEVHGRTDADAVGRLVTTLAQRVHEAGIDHLICSPADLDRLKVEGLSEKFKKITPGVRPVWAASNDQKRIMTPADAIRAGADMIVVGRPITNPPDGLSRHEAANRIYNDVRGVQPSSSGS